MLVKDCAEESGGTNAPSALVDGESAILVSMGITSDGAMCDLTSVAVGDSGSKIAECCSELLEAPDGTVLGRHAEVPRRGMVVATSLTLVPALKYGCRMSVD